MPPKYLSVSPSIGLPVLRQGFIRGLRQERREKSQRAIARGTYSADITSEDPAARRRGKNSLTSAGKKSAQPQWQLNAAPSTAATKARSQRPGTLEVQKVFG